MSYTGNRWLQQQQQQQQPMREYGRATPAAPSWVASRGRESPPRPSQLKNLAGWQPSSLVTSSPGQTTSGRLGSISPKRTATSMKYGLQQPLWEDKGKAPTNTELQRLRDAVAAAEARVAKFETTTPVKTRPTTPGTTKQYVPEKTTPLPPSPTPPPSSAPPAALSSVSASATPRTTHQPNPTPPLPSEYLQLVTDLRTFMSEFKKPAPSHDVAPLLKEQKQTLEALKTSLADIATQGTVSGVKGSDIQALKEAKAAQDERSAELDRKHRMLIEMEERLHAKSEALAAREAVVASKEEAMKEKAEDVAKRVETVEKREERMEAREVRFEEREKRLEERAAGTPQRQQYSKAKDTSYPPEREEEQVPVEKFHEGKLPEGYNARSGVEALSEDESEERGRILATFIDREAELGDPNTGEEPPVNDHEEISATSVPDSEPEPNWEAEDVLNQLIAQGIPPEMAMAMLSQGMAPMGGMYQEEPV
eukprot:TRINITY_DN1531_c1_g1_i1.p1 TRINITY_DN1531_c1_g1~~TRINITY_DN1531_c1_g1_i1.p1  ORF type:complete len:480 (+),score=149.11 TRINITY_DN1531_c1_g1_i1:56-1495(+)